MHEFEVGDKVVPHKKSTGDSLDKDMIWRKRKNSDMPYLIIKAIREDGSYILSTHFTDGGNYYKEGDFTLYDEYSAANIFQRMALALKEEPCGV